MILGFNHVSFKSTTGDVIDTKVVNGALLAKTPGNTDFTEFIACNDGWWWAGPADYSVKVHGDDILVSNEVTIGGNPVLYKRV